MHSHDGHHHDHEGGHKPHTGGLISLESLLEPRRKAPVNLDVLREKLAQGRGPQFSENVEEAAETEELREYVEQEFTACPVKFRKVWIGGTS